MLREKKGQSILEYVIVLVAIVACIIWAATQFIANKPNEASKGVGKLMEQSGEAMKAATGNLANIQ